MSKNKQKIEKKPQLTPIGRFVVWADAVDISISKKMIVLVFLIGLAGFAIHEQNSARDFFQNNNLAWSGSDAVQFSPEQDTMNSGILLSGSQNPLIKNTITGYYTSRQVALKKNIARLVAGKPMERMLDAVSLRDPETATYLVAIAKKESNLGKASPKDSAGNDCFNYWGFRGSYNQTASGYSCFDSPEQAVTVVGDRIHFMAQTENLDTPAKMSVWKCGYDCSWDNHAAVQKWIADVGFYYDKLSNNL